MAPKLALPQKRPLPDAGRGKMPSLTDVERKVYEAIRSKKDLGIWTADLKKETEIPQVPITRAIKSLLNKQLIKDVINVRNKARKMYMASEFEPAKEVSGGSWYSEGSIDIELIEVLRKQCRTLIEKKNIVTVDMITDFVRESHIFKMEFSTQQISEILLAMVLDREIEECRSTGVGDFSFVQRGQVCYRPLKARGGGASGGIFSSIPCGVCPRINECTPEGIVSPRTCVYYNKWLGLEF